MRALVGFVTTDIELPFHGASKIAKFASIIQVSVAQGAQASDFSTLSAICPSITLISARSASGTPSRDTPDMTSGVFFAARFSRAICSLICSEVSASALLSATIYGLSARPWP
jgi:hypothetical protein